MSGAGPVHPALAIRTLFTDSHVCFLLFSDQPRVGTHAGTDEYGNNYYYNPKDIVLRDRWIEYGRWNSDPSQIPPEWHQWIHHITDDIPTAQTVPKPFFTGKHLENLTGSRGAYKPYSTTVPKFTSWTPGTKERQG
ncbi:NADH ubiquinone oxidoreductase subunit NDUFA12-domain-containing protein [Fimicolochytrium jonesii]|uniref:NADH ubiquinone oxidoreductase subunit NDUFA12-domain-containing protein n=1 Tax=Fimicolochytrium jonesii TaxID=1396493 RepID=UPI0022FE2744|nr:NADH ubiquinone oxidoreductase subunit NDUFA12-domain-containing protein [Fimicolochytrium jonesii]KAI8824932.1 NADH ubiquinone oxidoreductase subunit NDUFA12-domain-containing protein [Fimicolochytrium jonesii]